ncbi:MAG: hypothetical protein OHK0029_28030 [Armatimonadaceae bacterium]
MPQGASEKREREYEELVEEFKEEGRYEGREEEVAARIVNKQRSEFGETQEAQEKDRRGESPDRNLTVENYDNLTVDEVTERLEGLSQKELRQIRAYEQKHRERKTMLEELDRRLEDG